MLAFAAPGLLLAGALAALVPLALHLIRRRPPTRAPFPTERFLQPDPRSAVRVSRPTDLLLLALRMALLLLAGAAFARPTWHPSARGSAVVVLLDAGREGSPAAYRAALGRARALLLEGAPRSRGALVVFDSSARIVPPRQVTPALFDSLAERPRRARASLGAALRAVGSAAAALSGADSLRLALLLGGAAWEPGLGPLRRAAWPGSMQVVPPVVTGDTLAPVAQTAPSPPSAEAQVLARGEVGRFVVPALEATGWRVRRVSALTAADSAQVLVLLSPPAAGDLAALNAALGRGATVLSAGAAAGVPVGLVPWTRTVGNATSVGDLWLEEGLAAHGALRAGGAPPADGRVVAWWGDGRPAAAALARGKGCLAYLAADLEAGALPLDAAYPRVLDRLARACAPPAGVLAEAPLDAGGIAVLRGSGPALVARSRIPGSGGGVPLGRWVLAAALAVALGETFLAYGRRSGA